LLDSQWGAALAGLDQLYRSVYQDRMAASPKDTRAELLGRALDLFAAYGYDGVGVQQICNASGVTKPTLYHHFGSKRGLLETLMAKRLGALHAALAEAGATPADFAGALTAVAEATFAFAASERTFYRLYLTLWFAPIRSEAYEVAQVFHARHFAAVERVMRDAEPSDPTLGGRGRALAAAFLGLVNNHVGLALNNYAALNPRFASEAVHAFLYGALSRPDHRAPKGRTKSTIIPIGT
jgi:TetR/AcrR family transcriptional regulator